MSVKTRTRQTATTAAHRAAADHAHTRTTPPADAGWTTPSVVALVGGPADGWWYHRADWDVLVSSTAGMAAVHRRHQLDPACWPLLYQPAGGTMPHRRQKDMTGAVYTWRGPAHVRSVRDLVELLDQTRAATNSRGHQA